MAYTNSPLVNYKKISPNKNSPRNHAIDTISIHCVVGQVTAESLGSIFANSSYQASSNYGVDKDGRIGLYVEEKDRSWCTSSASNDNRAITIEVASDTYHPYRITDKAYKSLVKLLVDICKRNNIKKLLWKGDKSLIGQVSKQNMTVHRWFANKSCPGDYLYNLHGQIAKEVNAQLGSATPSTPTPSPSKPTVKAPTVTFRVKQDGKWQKEGFVGTVGKAITDIAIKVSKGTVRYRVHVKGGGWLPYVTGYNINDVVNGYAGNGKAIDCVEVYYFTPSEISSALGYYRAKYRVSPVKKSYYSYQYDNEKKAGQDGYAGSFGQKIDRFSIELSK